MCQATEFLCGNNNCSHSLGWIISWKCPFDVPYYARSPPLDLTDNRRWYWPADSCYLGLPRLTKRVVPHSMICTDCFRRQIDNFMFATEVPLDTGDQYESRRRGAPSEPLIFRRRRKALFNEAAVAERQAVQYQNFQPEQEMPRLPELFQPLDPAMMGPQSIPWPFPSNGMPIQTGGAVAQSMGNNTYSGPSNIESHNPNQLGPTYDAASMGYHQFPNCLEPYNQAYEVLPDPNQAHMAVQNHHDFNQPLERQHPAGFDHSYNVHPPLLQKNDTHPLNELEYGGGDSGSWLWAELDI